MEANKQAIETCNEEPRILDVEDLGVEPPHLAAELRDLGRI